MLVVARRIVKCGLKRRHGENQPAMSGVNRRKFKNVTEKGAVRFWILGVDDDVSAIDQVKLCSVVWGDILTP